MPEEYVDDAEEAGPPLDAPPEPTLHILRHSAAHLLAAAVTELFPGAQYDVGPAIEDGFFYNFRLPDGRHFVDDDLPLIEGRMEALAAQRIPFVAEALSRERAVAMFTDLHQDFKVDIINRLPADVSTVSIYRTGEFVDLCRGPHVPDTGWLRAIRVLRIAGVYWRGDARNEQLQRVYGTAWFTTDELDANMHRLEAASNTDHTCLSG